MESAIKRLSERWGSVPEEWRYEAKSVLKTFLAACIAEALLQFDTVLSAASASRAVMLAAVVAMVRAGIKAVLALMVAKLEGSPAPVPWYPGDRMDTEQQKPATSASEEAAPAKAQEEAQGQGSEAEGA